MFGTDGVWGTWVRRWTAEEGRHSIVLRDYLTVTRAIDPVALERARMAQVECGEVPRARRRRATAWSTSRCKSSRRASRTTTRASACNDPAAYEVMKRIASDENRHYLFYRDLASAALELDPSRWCARSSVRCARSRCPAPGIVDFEQHAKAIARAGIYDFSVHYEQILVPVVLRHWNVEGLDRPHARSRSAPRRTLERIERIGTLGRRDGSPARPSRSRSPLKGTPRARVRGSRDVAVGTSRIRSRPDPPCG